MPSDEITIRRVTHADGRMIAECCAIAGTFLGNADFLAGAIQRDVNVRDNPMFVAEYGDASVAGFVVARRVEPGVGEISALYVRADMHRHGVGARLLRQIETCLHEAGIGVIHLNSRPWAVPFYQAHGYMRRGALLNCLQKSL